MKYIIFAVCVFGVVDIATSNLLSEYDFSLDPECPPPGNQSKSTYFPYYYDCQKYYECSEGVKVLMNCPSGLYWNIKLEVCDYLENVDCSYIWTSTKGPITPTTTTKPTPGINCTGVPDGTFFADPFDRTKFYECLNGRAQHLSCPSEQVWDQNRGACVPITPPTPGINCTGVPDGTFFADPFDRTKFYECLNGRAQHLSCPSEQVWDQNSRACVPISPPTPGINCTGVPDGTFFADPFDRTKFYECLNGRAQHLSCPSEQVWDQNRRACVPITPPTPGINCTGVPDGTFFADPFDRTKFYECLNGRAQHLSCPSEQVWDQNRRACVPITPPTPGINCTGVPDGTFFADPFDRTKFYECLNGRAQHLSCPSEQVWDQNRRACVPITPPTPGINCTGVPDGTFFADPFDRTKFYECLNGRAQHLSCPSEQVWDQNRRACVPITPPTPGIDCTGVPDGTFFADPFDRTKFYECFNGRAQHLSCPSEQVWDENSRACIPIAPPTPGINCTGVPDGTYFADPFDRTKFYECVKGRAVHLSCPTEQVWDENTRQCVPLTPPTPGIDCRGAPDGTYFADPFDRRKFYECVRGVAVPFYCPEGYIWDESRHQCVPYQPPTPKPTTPKPVPGINCTGVPDGTYFSDPFDRTKYYECVKGKAVHLSCPAEQIWNEDKRQCVPITPPTPGINCTGVPDGTYFADPFDRTKFYECVKGKAVHLSCPADQIWDEERLECVSIHPPTPGIDCTGVPDGTLFANPFDPTKFYECVKGVAVLFTCPAGHIWDERRLQCVANVPPTPPPTTTTVPIPGVDCRGVPDGTYFANPFDPTKFYECVKEVAVHFTCPAGKVWNQKGLVCV